MYLVGASIFRSKISSVIALLFVGVYAFGVWLIIWHAIFNNNPILQVMMGGAQASLELQ